MPEEVIMNQKKFETLFEEILSGAHQELQAKFWVEGDDVEKSSIEQEKTLDLKLRGRKALYLRKVEKALDRIKDGTFGECHECGDEIGEERLMARPTATMCINCKEEQEGKESHILYEKKSHTSGKGLRIANF